MSSSSRAISMGDAQASSLMKGISASEAKHLFTALRKAANHPLLLRVRYNDNATIEKIASIAHAREHFGNQCDLSRVKQEIYSSFSDFDIHQLCAEYGGPLASLELQEDALFDSPKMVALKELLPTLIEEGHRILVFSQWTRILDLLEVLMNHMSLSFFRLDGSTPVKERQDMIDRFNRENIPIFLLSTKAGGLGINLTAADTVIMHDLDFNPENDRQAEDRCHRIGQTKPVTVYKLICSNSVDDDIWDMAQKKTALSQAVLSNGRGGAGGGSAANAKNGTRGGGRKNDKDGGGDDLGMIQRILQKALASTTVGDGSPPQR